MIAPSSSDDDSDTGTAPSSNNFGERNGGGNKLSIANASSIADQSYGKVNSMHNANVQNKMKNLNDTTDFDHPTNRSSNDGNLTKNMNSLTINPLTNNRGMDDGLSPSDSFFNEGKINLTSTTTTIATPLTTKNTNVQMNFEEDDEVVHQKNLQLYVFICRCVAYPFNSKQATDRIRRAIKISKNEFQMIKKRFESFLSGETQIASDEAFHNAIQSFVDVFLLTDRCRSLIDNGAAAANDFREIFKANIEKRIRGIPDIDGLSKETVISAWMAKFDAICRGDDDSGAKKSKTHINAANQTAFTSLSSTEIVFNKENLFDIFQQLLHIKKFEHQLIYNEAQLGNLDEQAAAIRRELGEKKRQVDMMLRKRIAPKFVIHEMESLYFEEMKNQINELMLNLERQPVSKGSSLINGQNTTKKRRHRLYHTSETDDNETYISKLDVVLTFALEIVVMEVKGLSFLAPNKIVYCTMEVEGGSRLRTGQAEASKPIWDTQGDFTTNQPLPIVKVKLFTESSRVLSLDDKELGRIVIKPTPTYNRQPMWAKLQLPKNATEELKMKLVVRINKPQNLKMCGYCYCQGKNIWKKWKKRYLILVQVSQYRFAICCFMERKSDPTDILAVDGYTVDYCEIDKALALEGGKHFFNIVKEGDMYQFATDEENDRNNWIQALCRATGQTHKPVPPSKLNNQRKEQEKSSKSTMEGFIHAEPCTFNHNELFCQLQTNLLDYRLKENYYSLGWFSLNQQFVLDEYCARYSVRLCIRHLSHIKNLLSKAEEGIAVDPNCFYDSFVICANHVSDTTNSTQPSQQSMMLSNNDMNNQNILNNNNNNNIMNNNQNMNSNNNNINPNMNDQSNVNNQLQSNEIPSKRLHSILQQELDDFYQIRDRLRTLLEYQITHFRYSFPFGRPENGLRNSILLLGKILTTDATLTVLGQQQRQQHQQVEDLNQVLTRCLKNAALVNYQKISESVKVEDMQQQQQQQLMNQRQQNVDNSGNSSKKYLETVLFMAELCIDVLNQNQEFYLHAFETYPNLMREHEEVFWSLFLVDLEQAIESQSPDSWESFPLFQMLNDYLIGNETLNGGIFHQQLQDLYMPLLIRYVDLMESSIAQSINNDFEKETWKPKDNSCAASDMVLWKLEALQSFIRNLHWPDAMFNEHLQNRLKQMTADMIEACCARVAKYFEQWMKKGSLLGAAGCDYLLPSECCVMVNVINDCKSRAVKLCSMENGEMHRYHTKIDDYLETTLKDFQSQILMKLTCVLSSALKKFSRYDEGSLFAPILSLTKPVNELGQSYVTFIYSNLEQLRQKIMDELFVLILFQDWYRAQIMTVYEWLDERKDHQLHAYQLTCISLMVKKIHSSFELQGVAEENLNSKEYQIVSNRLKVEDTTLNISLE
ncbi:hypothetical protein SNEBB_009004 [Seison nebaliae]|nr:hypothetical protein SNEBB_009004 [Seison nebaliae]